MREIWIVFALPFLHQYSCSTSTCVLAKRQGTWQLIISQNLTAFTKYVIAASHICFFSSSSLAFTLFQIIRDIYQMQNILNSAF